MEAQGHILIRRKAKDGADGNQGPQGNPGTPGRDGSAGLDGVILWPSEWAENIAYRNETSKTTSPRYVDVVYIQNKALASGWEAYVCRQSHTSSTSNKPNGSTTTYWEKVSNFSAIMVPIILGKNSFINFMQGNRIQIENANGTVAAGMCAIETKNTDPVIWAGQTYANRAAAPFRVDSAGNMTATNATITGTVNATSGRIGGLRIVGNSLTNISEDNKFDNDAYIILRKDPETFVGIGNNVLPAVGGQVAVGRFENKGNSYLGTNYGLVVDVRNGEDNVAIAILGGSISGLALTTKYIDASNQRVTLDRNVGCVYVTTAYSGGTRDVYITLPTMEHYDDGHVIKIKRGSNNNNKVHIIAGSSHWNTPTTSNNVITGWTTNYGTSCLLTDSNTYITSTTTGLNIDSEGDAMEFVYFRDMAYQSGSYTYHGVWVQFKNPRAW